LWKSWFYVENCVENPCFSTKTLTFVEKCCGKLRSFKQNKGKTHPKAHFAITFLLYHSIYFNSNKIFKYFFKKNQKKC